MKAEQLTDEVMFSPASDTVKHIFGGNFILTVKAESAKILDR